MVYGMYGLSVDNSERNKDQIPEIYPSTLSNVRFVEED